MSGAGIWALIAERLKKALTIWIAVYPTALAVISLLGDTLLSWPLPLRLLVTTGLVVALVTNITQPLINASIAAVLACQERQRRSRRRS